MLRRIPQRPSYKREKRAVGFMVLTAFLLLFIVRMLADVIPFFGELWFLFLLEILIFLLPALIFVMLRGKILRTAVRLKLPRAANMPFLVVSFLALLCGGMLLSLLCGGADSVRNGIVEFDIMAYETLLEKLFAIFALAIFPALAEEFFFRGVVVAEYEKRGVIRALLMSTLLFAFIHFDIRNLPVYLFSGLLLILVLYATDSLIATMLLHSLYNVVSLLGGQYVQALFDFTGNLQLLLFILTFVLFISLILFCRFGVRIYRARQESGIGNPKRDVPYAVQFYTVLDALADPAVILSFIVAILGFIFL